MFVATMSMEEAIAEAKADLTSVQNKMRAVIQIQEREHRKNRRAGDRIAQAEYISPRKNNWLYVVTTTKHQTVHNVLMWFRLQDKSLCGLQLSYEGLHQLYTAHFLTRYRERSGAGAVDADENLRAFFFRNHGGPTMRTGREHKGFPAAIGALADGYSLGTVHADEGYVRCRTFINREQAHAYQAENREALEAIRELQTRYPRLYAQIRTTPPGGPAK
jgi:hypothetical protein